MKKHFLFLFVLFVFCFVFSSCTNSVVENKTTLEIVQKPIIEEVKDIDGLRVVSVTKAEYFLYKMEPLWAYSEAPYGSTIGLGVPNKPDGTSFGESYRDFKLASASSSSLGFFSQGKWELTIYVLDKDYNRIIKEPITNTVYLNSFSNKLSIDLDNRMFVSGTNCSIKIDNFRFCLTEKESLYGQEEKDGYKINVSISKIQNGTANILESVTSLDIPVKTGTKTNIEFLSKSGAAEDPKVYGVIKDFYVANNLQNGSYVVSIKLYEHNGLNFVDAGGMTFSFVAKNGFVSVIEGGDGTAIDLKAADYKEFGSGDIIIDSGIDAQVEITASVSGTVNVDTPVTFTGKVNETETVGYWLVNGDKNTMKSGSTFTYTPTSSDAGKTVTITYMILDSSYNTISTNYYLSVKAST